MAVFRLTHVNFEEFNALIGTDTDQINEWAIDDLRAEDPVWQDRYKYESQLILRILNNRFKNKKIDNILEIGSGPGMLSQFIQTQLSYPIQYDLIDKPLAKKYFDKNNFKGNFFVKDISIDLDTNGLLPKYDIIICNDVLEHLFAPALIMRKIHSLMHDKSRLMISVPSWRMGHQFLYRGLFDYDNFMYFCYIHQIEMESVYPSILKTQSYPKLDSESAMPDELLQSWNYYFIGKTIQKEK